MRRHQIKLICVFLTLVLTYNAKAQTYKRLTNLPHVYVTTFNMVSITSKDNYVYSKLIYVDENDVVTRYDSVQIRGRGNSTWNLAKKPYKIKFKEKTKFLGEGFANAKKWTLMANAGDKTLIRNALTSEMARFMGMPFCPAAKFVDFTLNGEYLGNYQISDQVEVKNHRVNIPEQDYPLTASSNITGGYLLEVDGFKDGNWFSSSKSVAIRITYPDEDEIATSQSNYIKNYINAFEKRLFAQDFTDPLTGYRPMVDSISLANQYLVTEITGNIDGFWSMYFFKNQNDSLLYFGPPWDYDIAFANDYRIQPTQTKMMVDEGFGDAKTWFKQMWNDQSWFSKLINRRFKQLIDSGLENYLYEKIDSLTTLIQESRERNYKKWSISSRAYHEINLYTTYDDYVDDLKSFIHEHIAFLETAFARRMPEEPTPPFEPERYYYNILNAKTSKPIDVSSPDGGTYSETNLPQNGTNVCSGTLSDTKLSQLWTFERVGEYFLITNRLGLALNDPTPGTSTATTNLGTQLNVVTPDKTDERQLWTLTPQGTAGYYNITNLYTQHTANLNGGGSAEGTPIVSYTTDSRNSQSTNRLWYIRKTNVELPKEPKPVPGFKLSLSQGWNWVTHVLERPVAMEEMPTEAIRVVTNMSEAARDSESGKFVGSLNFLSPGEMFKIYVENQSEVFIEGNLNRDNLVHSIRPGWTWIGYTGANESALADVFQNQMVEEGDILMGRYGFAEFSDRQWHGTLQTLVPGQGYLYKARNFKTLRFIDIDGTSVKQREEKQDLSESQFDFGELKADFGSYPDVMGIIAVVVDAEDKSVTDRFSLMAVSEDGECRGVGRLIDGMMYMSVYGSPGEIMHLKAFDNSTGEIFEVTQTFTMTAEVIGTVLKPLRLSIAKTGEPTSLDGVQGSEKAVKAVYSLSGIKVSDSLGQLPNGIYIVILSDGTRKVIAR